MMTIKKYFLCFIMVVAFGTTVNAQTADTTSSSSNQVVDLSDRATIIKVEIDKPRVNIFSDRIKPEFDEVHLQKSFMPELSGRGEQVILKNPEEKKKQYDRIDVEKMINRNR